MEEPSPIRTREDRLEVVSVDAKWLADHLRLPVETAEVKPFDNAGGLYAILQKVTAKDAEGKILYRMVLKSLLGERLTTSKILGAAREAQFYKELVVSGNFPPIFPEIVYSFGDMQTGVKFILMKDASDGIHSGYFFGRGSPMNEGKDLAALVEPAGGVTAHHITNLAAICAAQFQAIYWGRTSELSSKTWLKGMDWAQGNGRDSWESSHKFAKDMWEIALKKRSSGESAITWEPDLLALMDASLGKTSWDEFQERMRRFPLTLVHGDYHPGNMMYMHEEDKLLVLDWELVGIGSGPQDIGQYMISHASPDARCACEKDIMAQYHSVLAQSGVDVGLEACMSEYVMGGIERFIWLLACMAGSLPDGPVQFFHDQIYAFMKDHNVTSSNVGQPRP